MCITPHQASLEAKLQEGVQSAALALSFQSPPVGVSAAVTDFSCRPPIPPPEGGGAPPERNELAESPLFLRANSVT